MRDWGQTSDIYLEKALIILFKFLQGPEVKVELNVIFVIPLECSISIAE